MSRARRKQPFETSPPSAPDSLRLHRAEAEMNRLRQRLAELREELTSVETVERRRLAEALHASVGQVLSLCRIKLDQLGQELTPGLRSGILEAIRRLLNTAIEQTQTLVSEMHPPALHSHGLAAAVEHLAAQFRETHQFQVVLRAEHRPDGATPTVRALLYSAIRELLTNACKYSARSFARVTIAEDAQCLRVEVEDAGQGFNPGNLPDQPTSKGRFGLLNIRQRCEEIGATFRLSSGPGQGTVAGIVVPLSPAAGRVRERRSLRAVSRLRAARPHCPGPAARDRLPLTRASL